MLNHWNRDDVNRILGFKISKNPLWLGKTACSLCLPSDKR